MCLGIVRAKWDAVVRERSQMKPAEGSTVIGKSVKIRGEITGAEDLYLDGEIQGTVTLPGSKVTIGPNAHILADIEGRDVVVFGHVEGNIISSGRVELRQTATVQGDIYTSRLSIEEKAEIQGRVDVGVSGPTITVPKQVSGEVHTEAAPLFSETQG